MENPFKILHVDEDSDLTIVRKRFKKLSKIYHPDKHEQDPTSVLLFQILQNAYEKIKNIKEHNTYVIPVKQTQARSENTKNHTTTLAQPLHDPYFTQDFALSEYFSDISIPEKKKNDDRLASDIRMLKKNKK